MTKHLVSISIPQVVEASRVGVARISAGSSLPTSSVSSVLLSMTGITGASVGTTGATVRIVGMDEGSDDKAIEGVALDVTVGAWDGSFEGLDVELADGPDDGAAEGY